MKLLLSGGGDPERVVHIDEFFVSQIDLNRSVLYIPVAWEDDPSYIECYDWFKKTYQPYGVKDFEMCTNLNTATNLDKYSAVFIGGGNTFKLLKEIKESRFDERIIEYLNNSGFVYGGSAGSIIFGKNILATTYEDENNVGCKRARRMGKIRMKNDKNIILGKPKIFLHQRDFLRLFYSHLKIN